MKIKRLCLIVMLFTVQICAIGQIIKDSKQSIVANRFGWTKKFWVPSREETKIALEATMNFLKTKGYHTKDNVKNIGVFDRRLPALLDSINKKVYCVQFFGYYNEKGEKEIYCNFFYNLEREIKNCTCTKDSLFIEDKMKESMLIVADGGIYFWSITYNTKTRMCYDFGINFEG